MGLRYDTRGTIKGFLTLGMLVDSHAHLTMPELASDLSAVLDRAVAAGVSVIVCVGVDLPSSKQAVQIAQQRAEVVAAVGVHPNDCADLAPSWLDVIRGLCELPGVVAIGEIGLDYYRQRADRTLQREVFLAQLELARELELPVVVHNRQASVDMAEILQDWAATLPRQHRRGVLHCFSGDLALMRSCCGAGFCVSFAGPITYPNARPAAEVAIQVPEDRLLVETDAPYLAPHPYRGKQNEPAMLPLVARRLAALRQESFDRIAELTTRNAARLFGLEIAPASDLRE